ncbi:MAG TPA: putative N-acetylmannosamine-6-phosphate 2-epimerase [Anaerolineaceae bacterium]|nr:putative N-acetylmannosamine-6-phosphate 2-epimerase [Anaerolineaceae bacterium]
MNTILSNLQNKLIVSCQAFPSSPLYGADYMQKMAMCAIQGGAGGIRACWADNVKAVREITNLPVVGINKLMDDEPLSINKVYITPTFESAAEVIEAGADILGMDCTPRGRTYDDIHKIVEQIRKHYPAVLIMADLSTLEEGVKAAEMGVDIVSTTLSGYTPESLKVDPEKYRLLMQSSSSLDKASDLGPDFGLIQALRENVRVKINAEGRISEANQVVKAMQCGADMITIGAAITMPEKITGKFVNAMKPACLSNVDFMDE